MTFMEPHFRERYRRYTWSAMFLPIIVVTLAVVNLTLLVTIFFFWASVHVIHQGAYIADSYRFKDPLGRAPDLARWQLASRVVDYGLLVTSLYPIATFTFTGVPLVIFAVTTSPATGSRRAGGRSSSPTSLSSSGSDRSPPASFSFCSPL